MKKYNTLLTYKDLYAIKHALDKTVSYKRYVEKHCVLMPSNETQLKEDIEHEAGLLERITERINEIKYKYKIGE
jgi:hypothetical protein